MTIYLLGIIDTGGWIEFGPIGFTNSYGEKTEVRTVPYSDISMVVCELDYWKVNESDKVDLLNKLLEHQKVLEKIMQRQFILPVKFGTTVENEHDVVEILNQYYTRLKSGYEEMKDFVEIDVVVTWDTTEEIKRMAESDEAIKKIKAEVEKLPQDKRGEKIIEVGMLLEDKLEERRSEIEKDIFKGLSVHCLDRVDHGRLEDKMVINSSFLLKKGAEDEFFDAIDKLDRKLDRTLRFKCISPLPPHSFKTIAIDKIDPQELKDVMAMFGATVETTLDELKDKNRKLIKKLHPDKARKAEAAVEFDKMNKGFKLLSSIIQCNGRLFSDAEMKKCYLLEFHGG